MIVGISSHLLAIVYTSQVIAVYYAYGESHGIIGYVWKTDTV